MLACSACSEINVGDLAGHTLGHHHPSPNLLMLPKSKIFIRIYESLFGPGITIALLISLINMRVYRRKCTFDSGCIFSLYLETNI
jgi:hypothetical protein